MDNLNEENENVLNFPVWNEPEELPDDLIRDMISDFEATAPKEEEEHSEFDSYMDNSDFEILKLSLINQVSELDDISKRLKYYLDEINIFSKN